MFELPTDLSSLITSTGLFKFFRDETNKKCFYVQIDFHFYTFKKDHGEIKMLKLTTLDEKFWSDVPEVAADTPADATGIKDFQLFDSN